MSEMDANMNRGLRLNNPIQAVLVDIVDDRSPDYGYWTSDLMYGHVMAAVKKCFYGLGLLRILAHMHGYQSRLTRRAHHGR